MAKRSAFQFNLIFLRPVFSLCLPLNCWLHQLGSFKVSAAFTVCVPLHQFNHYFFFPDKKLKIYHLCNMKSKRKNKSPFSQAGTAKKPTNQQVPPCSVLHTLSLSDSPEWQTAALFVHLCKHIQCLRNITLSTFKYPPISTQNEGLIHHIPEPLLHPSSLWLRTTTVPVGLTPMLLPRMSSF